jgi:Cupin-like domain
VRSALVPSLLSGVGNDTPRRSSARTNTPVILTDVTADWPAFAKWTVQALRTTYGDVGVHAGGFTFAMRDYLAYAEGCESSARAAEDTPLYVFDKAVLLAPGVLAPDFEPPQQFAAQRDLFSLLERDGHPGGRPDHCWLIMGPLRSGSAWHVDPNATSAWNAVVLGCKHWIMFPPGCTPPGVMASDDGAHVAQPSSLVDWYLNFYDACHERGRERRQKLPAPMECNLRSGELLFVPSGWWHCALNTAPGITLAVTQNLVTEANLSKVLAHLARGDEDLISGIAPEHRASLGPRLLAALHTHAPDVLRAATHSRGPAAGPGTEQWVSGGEQGSGGWAGRAAVNADEGARTFAFNFS